ncbi:hypothetical protein OEZ85_006090 [Tetradesmus obliquus]|uniref:Armadillo repeat-containing domain-containing protein n=1 Tax=Tetradesmus obliquus TaxID=3088 RepID=A0ABY8UGG8_TETOB|nr:hypothetical protein OEZ85_006090 [Tetradesmus obliquus]
MSSDSAVAAAVVAAGGVPVLVHALRVSPPAVCQVTTFSLFRLMREVDGDLTEDQLSSYTSPAAAVNGSSSSSSEAGSSQDELLLLQYVRHGAFSKLCAVMGAGQGQGSAHELAFSMLLSLALLPQAQRLVADRGEVASIVQVLSSSSSPATRLEAMLVLGRLAARCVAVQQDAVREGAVPPLVDMMQAGTDEERCHASRLLALLGQHASTHQAVGVVCMLVHNPDNHFAMVGEGLVPLLVSLLHRETPGKTLTYALASLLMLAIAEPRHAAVVARTGAVPLLVLISREGSHRPVNRELAAALLAVLCRSQDVQVDVVAAGGIPALARLMAEGTDGARCYACEALAQIASGTDVRCRLVARAGALAPLRSMLAPGGSSLSTLWAARLLKVLVQEHSALREVAEVPGLIALLPEVLGRRPLRQQQQQQQQQDELPPTAAGSTASSPHIVPGVTTSSSSSVNGGVNMASMDVEVQGEVASAAAADADLEKAQAQLAWVVAALAANRLTRGVISEVGCFLIRPLVAMLREAQAGCGAGLGLADVLEGLANSRQAAAAAALRGLSRADDRLAALVNAELALQWWLGHRVELPRLAEEGIASDWYPPME